MFYKNEGMPEEDNLVVCTVTKILYHSIFVTLDEYKGLEGMIHISEIAPGRIRNIRDYVKEGKQLICKVLKANPTQKQFDLSLRRVSIGAMKQKNEEYKQEQKAEKILEVVAHNMKKELKDVYENAGYKILKEYGLLMPCFQKIAKEGEQVLKNIKVDPVYAKKITDIIKERIKPLEITTSIVIELRSSAPNGIEIIKRALKAGEEFAEKNHYNASISYLSAPKYRLSITSANPKESEETARKTAETIAAAIKKEGGEGSFSEK